MALALALGLAGPAAAERVSPDAFERLVEGRVLTFSVLGRPFGAEQYLPGREVIWQSVDGACRRGWWRAQGDALCFTYEDDLDEELCWIVERDDEGLTARIDDGSGFQLRFGPERPQPLVCDADPPA